MKDALNLTVALVLISAIGWLCFKLGRHVERTEIQSAIIADLKKDKSAIFGLVGVVDEAKAKEVAMCVAKGGTDCEQKL